MALLIGSLEEKHGDICLPTCLAGALLVGVRCKRDVRDSHAFHKPLVDTMLFVTDTSNTTLIVTQHLSEDMIIRGVRHIGDLKKGRLLRS